MGLAAAGISGVSLWSSIFGLVLGLALMMPGHLLGATGAGDVKLMGAVGAIVGPAVVVSAFLFSAVAGGVLAVIVALRRRRLTLALAGTGRLISAPSSVKQKIEAAGSASRFAYGPAIAAGSIIAALLG
jgi:prepilin peptidase CpaA